MEPANCIIYASLSLRQRLPPQYPLFFITNRQEEAHCVEFFDRVDLINYLVS